MALLDDDELYSGYNDYPNALSIKDLEQDEIFQQAVKTSYGRRPNVSANISIGILNKEMTQ